MICEPGKRYTSVLEMIADIFGKRSKFYKEFKKRIDEKDALLAVTLDRVRRAIILVNAFKEKEQILYETQEGTMKITVEINASKSRRKSNKR